MKKLKLCIMLLLILLHSSCGDKGNENQIPEAKDLVRIGNPLLHGKKREIDSLQSLSNAEAVSGNLSRAKELSKKIYILDSTNAYALSRLGYFALLKGENEKALKFINKSIKYDVKKEYTHNIAFKASALYELGNEDSADYYFKKMPDYNNQGAVDLWQLIIGFNNTFAFDKVIQFNNITLKYYPNDPFAKTNEANRLVNNKKYKEAMAIYNSITIEEAKSAYFYASRSACYMYLKEFDKALKDIRKAIVMEPNKIEHITRLARIYEKIGNYPEATKHYKAAMAGGDTTAVRLYKEMSKK